MKKTILAFLISALAAGTAGSASADAYAGHITSYFVSVSSGLAFRVYLDVSTPNCPANLFYVEPSNTNYQAYVSGLLTAFSMQKNVIITYTVAPSGYCSIIEYQVMG